MIFLAGFCLLVLPIALAPLNSKPVPITKKQFEKIKLGMTGNEVKMIVGIAPGIYTDLDLHDYEWAADPDLNRLSLCWLGDEGCIIVSLDDEEVVYAKKFGASRRKRSLNMLKMFLDWLGW